MNECGKKRASLYARAAYSLRLLSTPNISISPRDAVEAVLACAIMI